MEHIKEEQIEIYANQLAKGDNAYCGDSYFLLNTNDYFICVLADGLGSGKPAYESSNAVIEVVKSSHDEDVQSLMNMCNDALQQKRGAAVSILKLYYREEEFVYSSVGNIRFYLCSPEGKLTYPLPVTGYLSGRPQKYHTKRFPYNPHSKFLLHSDGLRMSGIKSLLTNSYSIDDIQHSIEKCLSNESDDTTYIAGSLL